MMKELLFPCIWEQNWSEYIGWGIGALGVILTTYFYFKTKKRKDPVYICKTTRLIQSNINQIDLLEVFYNSQKLNALSITKVVFWNAGRETISKSDIATKDRLRITIDEQYEILSCDVLTQTMKANDFVAQIADDKKSILISFDYINYEDGAVFKIRHTGSSSSNLRVEGQIKSVKAIRRKRNPYFFRPRFMKIFPVNRKFRWLLLVLGILAIALPIIVVGALSMNSIPFSKTSAFVGVEVLGTYIFACVGYILLRLYGEYANRIPDSLLKDYISDDF